MRIVILSSGGPYAERVLTRLTLASAPAEALVLTHRVAARAAIRRQGLRLLRDPQRLASSMLRRLGGEVSLEGLAVETRQAGELNSPSMLATLEDVAPDLLVLAGVGIVGAEALAVPRVGTVNVHPGLLPWVRGVGVVERSLDREVPVGVTAHFVDAGIDTGPVIVRRLVPVTAHDNASSLRLKAEGLCVDVLLELIDRVRSGETLDAHPQVERHAMATWPSREERASLSARVAAGLALELYVRWRDAAGSDLLPIAFSPP